MITLLADKNIPFLTEMLPDGVTLALFDPDSGFLSNTRAADALIIRTVTPINSDAFNTSKFPNLKFVGSASAGFDHVDVNYLNKLGISFYHAAGCNANAVAEYVTTGILDWVLSKKLHPEDLTVGIVGAGHTGSATCKLLESVGFTVILNDPPREVADPTFNGVDKSAILATDIISFHVPLKKSDEAHPTFHWLDANSIEKMNAKLIVNASRGGVVDEIALMEAKSRMGELDFILDVWENEPAFNPTVLKLSQVATPHIAGYSKQSKLNGTSMVVDTFTRHFQLNRKKTFNPESSSWSPSPEFSDATGVRSLHPMFELSEKLKTGVSNSEKNNRALFRQLRTHSTLRDEYRYLSAEVTFQNSPIRALFKGLHV